MDRLTKNTTCWEKYLDAGRMDQIANFNVDVLLYKFDKYMYKYDENTVLLRFFFFFGSI